MLLYIYQRKIKYLILSYLILSFDIRLGKDMLIGSDEDKPL